MTSISPYRLALSVLLAAFASATARAQDADSTSRSAKKQPLIGTTRVSLNATYLHVRQYSSFLGSVGAAPIVSDHVQLGIAPTSELESSPSGRYHAETVALLANYLFRDGSRSRPYVGAYLMEGGESLEHGYGVFGLQAGWLRFLTPSAAFRAEFRFRRFSSSPAPFETDDLLFTIDPYLFGRADDSLTTLPAFGTFDASFVGVFEVHPNRDLSVVGSVAPFLTRWLQAGLQANYVSSFAPQSSARNLELFGRGYLPTRTRFAPFGDLFVGTSTLGSGDPAIGSHGARAGVRSYLARGVALDLAFEWRNFAPYSIGGRSLTPPEQRSLAAGLVMQFRSKRSRS